MAIRWISLVAMALTLFACGYGGFGGFSREFSGVWLYEFEGSNFVEGATGIPTQRPASEEADWFEWTEWPRLEALMDKDLSYEDCHRVQAFRVTFVGRRTHHPFGVGHLGLSRSKVTVQRPISAERLGPPFCYDR